GNVGRRRWQLCDCFGGLLRPRYATRWRAPVPGSAGGRAPGRLGARLAVRVGSGQRGLRAPIRSRRLESLLVADAKRQAPPQNREMSLQRPLAGRPAAHCYSYCLVRVPAGQGSCSLHSQRKPAQASAPVGASGPGRLPWISASSPYSRHLLLPTACPQMAGPQFCPFTSESSASSAVVSLKGFGMWLSGRVLDRRP
ncbi:hypothetical protein H1C71_037662, partial [Ictidomys tridecemlineatus]